MIPPNPVQAMVDSMNRAWEKERAATQMTLGKLIKHLEENPGEIAYLDSPHSYRGYYSDLAFELSDKPKVSTHALLIVCRHVRGSVLEGYKGGEYPMHDNTPVWISSYGTTGVKLMGFDEQGNVITRPDEDNV